LGLGDRQLGAAGAVGLDAPVFEGPLLGRHGPRVEALGDCADEEVPAVGRPGGHAGALEDAPRLFAAGEVGDPETGAVGLVFAPPRSRQVTAVGGELAGL